MLQAFGRFFQTTAVILLNCFILFVIANLIAIPYVEQGAGSYDARAHRDQWLDRHGIETMRRVYPGLSDQQIKELLLQTGQFGQLFEPYIQTKSEPMVLEHTAFHPAGFRFVGRDQAGWPMDRNAFNVFVFGGSTVVGSGVRDDHAIPAVLQRLLRQTYPDRAINIYNFATAGHYSTQERIYFEQLILQGNTPDAVIFVDGLNDFYFWQDQPAHTDMMRAAFKYFATEDYRTLPSTLRLLVLRLPLTKVALRAINQANTGGMPTVSLVSPAFAATNIADNPARIEAVIERYLRFRRMAESVATAFDVAPVFVWQPVPLHQYEAKLRLFPVVGDHLLHETGYPAMARRVASTDMGKSFVWCADAFRNAERPLYLDSVHYTVEGNEIVAQCIMRDIVARGLLSEKLTKRRGG